MAEQLTLSKTSSMNVSCPVKSTVIQDLDNPYYYEATGTGLNYRTLDLSVIPESAEITGVSVEITENLTKAGTVYYSLRNAEHTNIGVYNGNEIKEYLNDGNRVFDLLISYRVNSFKYHTIGLTAVNASFKVKTTVTYEVSGKTKIMLGTADGWKEVTPSYCDRGIIKPCRAYYGLNGEWVEVGA